MRNGSDRALSGKRVVVTGAARGIGAGVARALAAHGARVALVGLEPDQLRAEAEAIGPSASWHEADVTDAAGLATAIGAAVAQLGGLDVAFANAGIAAFAPLRTMAPAQLRRVIDVNVLGVYHTLTAVLPHLLASKGYALINASLAAALTAPGLGAYSASKAAAEALGDGLRQEVRHLGVDVGVCYFGWIDTDMVRGAGEHPGFRYMRQHLPPPLRSTLPLDAAVDAAVRGIARRSSRVIAPRGLRALLPLRWMLALSTPRQAAPLMPEIERLSAESDTRFGGVTPTTEHPEDLAGAAARD
jgi:NAD(P)-dependent dehydrogenase (short-subunit alcohol dehydrogenase family)